MPKLFRGNAKYVLPVDLSCQALTAAQGLDSVSTEDPIKVMSKLYWEKTPEMSLTSDQIDAMKFPGEHWHDVDTAPIDGEKFLGRIKGTNKARAVWWADEFESFCDGNKLVEITQWTSFKEYAQVQQCIWNGGCN